MDDGHLVEIRDKTPAVPGIEIDPDPDPDQEEAA
jgi:hypothetical protein